MVVCRDGGQESGYFIIRDDPSLVSFDQLRLHWLRSEYKDFEILVVGNTWNIFRKW